MAEQEHRPVQCEADTGDGGAMSTPDRPDARIVVENKSTVTYSGDAKSSMIKTLRIDDDSYDMTHTHRGRALIINNKTFEPSLNMSNRQGTDLDAERLLRSMRTLGFQCQQYNDLTCNEILKVCKKVGSLDHTDNDAFMLAILSHGDEGVIYGKDGLLPVTQITEYFNGDKCRTLVGKPKVFLIQACRGTQLLGGVEIDGDETDAPGRSGVRLPVEADILIAYSTIAGYFSWRNPGNGSWFVQALASVISEYGGEMEFVRLLTKVNKKVAYDFESYTLKESMNRKKQIPCITSMLTKDLFFLTKK